MQIDISPLITDAVELGALAMTVVGTWALQRLAQRLGVQLSAARAQLVDATLTKAIGAGAAAAEQLAAAKGWDHPDVKNATLAGALQFLDDHAAAALKTVGLDPVADKTQIAAHLNALLPAAMAPIAASPATTSGP